MENDAVHKEFENIADYWMDLGEDGFRMDAAMYYTENATVANSDVLNYYKRALRLRNENPEIARGTIEKIDSLCDGSVAAITKTYDKSYKSGKVFIDFLDIL